jgi:hypothetical protein
MKAAESKYVSQSRAAMLLGISEPELCRISGESGFGHKEFTDNHEELFFTYEELRRICQLAVHQLN